MSAPDSEGGIARKAYRAGEDAAGQRIDLTARPAILDPVGDLLKRLYGLLQDKVAFLGQKGQGRRLDPAPT